MKLIHEMWTKLDNEEKEKMKQEYLVKIAKYNAAVSQYKETLSEEDRNKILEAELEKKDLKRLEKMHSKKPRRPMNSFARFIHDKYAEKKLNDVSTLILFDLCIVIQWLNNCYFFFQLHNQEFIAEWRNLNPEEKAKYQAQYEADKKAYEEAIIEWEAQMIRDGKEHLVSASMLPKAGKKRPDTQDSPKTAKKTPKAPPPTPPRIE